MSSLYSRPESPPPRQPSPDILPTPLPCPHQARRVASQPKIRIHSPGLAPGLHTRTKTLNSPRSCDLLAERPARFDDDGRSSFHSERKRTRSTVTSTLTVSSLTSSPSTSPAPSTRSTPELAPKHRRTLSVAYSASGAATLPPPSPSPVLSAHRSVTSPVPSVPYRYTGPKHIICPKPMSLAPINLSELEEQPSRHMPFPTLPLPRDETQQQSQQQQPRPALPPLERHKSMGIACLKFFGIRSPPRQPQSRVAAM